VIFNNLKYILLFLLLSINCYSQVGYASWYGNENKISSSGKKLNKNKPEAAHKTLPLGTVVKITVVKTGKHYKAVIKDRGPYVKNRIIDVNKYVAKKLGILNIGLVMVKIEICH